MNGGHSSFQQIPSEDFIRTFYCATLFRWSYFKMEYQTIMPTFYILGKDIARADLKKINQIFIIKIPISVSYIYASHSIT